MKLFNAPHRAFFLGGLLQVLLALAIWSLWLAGALGGAYPLPRLPMSAVALHGFLMVYGIFPFFVWGFLATTYPRWMQGTALPRATYRNSAVLRVAGIALVYLSLMVGLWVTITGIVIMAVGDARLALALLQVYRQASVPARRGVAVFNVTICAEVVGLLLYALGLYSASTPIVALAIRTGLFLFLLPTLFGVSYRMIPFFTASALPHYQRPPQSARLPLWFLLGTALHALFATLGVPGALIVVDGLLAFASWHYLSIWFRRDVVQHGLLLLLYAGFAWSVFGYALYGIHDLSLVLGHAVLGRAPLHALGLGFALSLVVAMVTRVTRGHSGRALQSDRLSWLALIGVQIAAILRVAAAFPAIDHLASINLSVLAAPVAMAVLLPWVLRYSYILLTAD
ncbi:MAG TPA: NnrS family protein [Acidiferrobacter sp.]|nr:NnrS family protein [Acidiferrobacter sp.]